VAGEGGSVVSARIAEQIADAVLYEGYVLYPYRASAAKNRVRWQVGLVTPRAYAEATGSDPWFMQTECLAEIDRAATLTVRARCLHVQERTIEEALGAEAHCAKVAAGDETEWRTVHSLLVDDRQLITWDEAVASELIRGPLPLDGTPQKWCFSWKLDPACDRETVHDRSGRLAARVTRRRSSVLSAVRIETEPCGRMLKIRVRVENLTPCRTTTLGARDAAVRQSLAGTHSVLAVENGTFLSLLDPPRAAAALAASCINTNTFPVLVGPPGSRSVMLSSPIILYDHPAVAPESSGDFCDATEIDEMLMLRVKTLTEDEKREARATDNRAAQIIDRCEAASADTMGHLHGAVRHYADAPSGGSWLATRSSKGDEDSLRGGRTSEDWESFLNPPDHAPPHASVLEIGGARICRGARVRLEPAHRADSMDICLRGRTGTVMCVYRTLEDKPYVAVALDDDPFGAIGERYRRSLFFHPDEIVPLDADTGGAE
jgi:hypothetical protein